MIRNWLWIVYMDPLSDILGVLRPHTILSKPISGSGDWGVRYSAYDMPGYALVLEGTCWLTLAGGEPVRLDAGDFVLLPGASAFEMTSRPGAACIVGEPSERPTHYGDPEVPPELRMLGGSFEIERANAPLLSALLPHMIHLRADEIDVRGLSQIIGFIVEESEQERPGADMILQRLLEILLIEVLRSEPIKSHEMRSDLLGGMRDPAIAKALRAIHADVGSRWTVASLADLAGMSRSAFAARFRAAVGCGPIDYLARWRMALARDALSRGPVSLDRLAEQIGYESASGFSTAFRRHMGCAPGGFARSFVAEA